MTRSRGGNRWEDHYTRRARKENYPARSIYKLQEIQQKFGLIRRGHRVLDLGCAPGSWLLYAARQVGPGGRVLGIDLQPPPVDLPANVTVTIGDVAEWSAGPAAGQGDFDVVLSDMAPATTGNKTVDTARSQGLCETALGIARQVLRPGGAFVCKIFRGPDFDAFHQAVKSAFEQVRIFKPRSSRKASREIFVVGIRKR
jgi:23S rRNA (uridine2552-2'-O)-methyltransferase